MTLADHILGWLAAGSMQRHELEERARVAIPIRDYAAASVRVGSALLPLIRRGLVSLHPVRGFCLTPAGKAKATTPSSHANPDPSVS